MNAREIAGPQDRFEHRGSHAPYRDVRPVSVRLRQWLAGRASALVLGGMAGITVMVPGAVDLTAATGVLYSAWVLTRRIEMPLRMPLSARRRDWSYTRKKRMASGDEFIGWCAVTGKEIWQSDEDMRQHGTLPGTTGAGKTGSVISSQANTLAKGSGFCLVDGKANSELYGQGYVLLRRNGREDDYRVLNLLTASLSAEATAHGYNPHKQTNSFNPFATGNADALRELLASQLGEAPPNDSNGVFRERAVALIGTIAPVLVWMRERKGIPIDIEKIRFMVELRSIWTLATHKVFLVRDAGTNELCEIPVPDIPVDLIYPLQAYLGEIPGYDVTLPYNMQKTEKPFEQHGYAIFYFTATFTKLAVSLGHIFKVERGDIEMRDIVMNRRVLLVNLPALENSDETLAALGRIVIASLRAMMAQLLGAKLEGDPREIFAHKPGMGVAPFRVDFDELGYYATAGMDRMLAMGRGINMAFRIAFQELGGIWARLGEKTHSLLGNANLTYAMRQKEAQRTREWLEKTGGQAWVTQATSFQGASDGAYREAQHAEMRQVNRVDWQDLQDLQEGEAVLLTGAERVYARLFYQPLEIKAKPRLNRPLMLAAPDAAAVRGFSERTAAVRARIEEGSLYDERERPLEGVLAAMAEALERADAAGASPSEWATAALDAAGCASAAPAGGTVVPLRPSVDASPDAGVAGDEDENEDAAPPPSAAGTGRPVTEFTPMLDVVAVAPPQAATPAPKPREPVDDKLLKALIGIEAAAGAPKARARASALAALGARDAALAAIQLPDSPRAAVAGVQDRVERLTARIDDLVAAARPADGPSDDGWQEAAE